MASLLDLTNKLKAFLAANPTPAGFFNKNVVQPLFHQAQVNNQRSLTPVQQQFGPPLQNPVIKQFGQDIQQGVGAALRLTPPAQLYQSALTAQYPAFRQEAMQQNIGDVYKGLKLPGYIATPAYTLAGGALNLGIQGITNKLKGQGFFGPQSTESFAQGMSQAAPLGPISAMNPFLAKAGQLPTAGQRVLGKAGATAVEGLAQGALEPLNPGESRRGKIVQNTGFAGLMGGLVGGGEELAKIPAQVIGSFAKKVGVSNDLMKQFIRDESGRFAKQEYIPKNEPVFYGDIREKLGLPRNGDYIPSPGFTTRPVTKAISKMKIEATPQAVQSPTTDFVKEMDALVGKPVETITKPKLSVSQVASSDAEKMVAKAQIATEGNQRMFQKIFSTFIGERDAAKTKGTVVGSMIKILPADPKKIITAIENPNKPTSPVVAKYIEQFRNLDNEVFDQAKKLGLDINYLQNHIAHFWKESPQQVEQAYMVFKQKYNLSNHRTIPTYEEGIRIGLTPKYTNPSQILAESVQKLQEAKAGIKAFTDLKDHGFIVPASVGSKTPGFVPITAPGFPKSAGRVNESLGFIGNWYAPQQIADQINRVFSPQDYGVIGSLLGKTRGVSGVVQDVGLSGGVPGTPGNAFGVAQVLKETTAGRPIQGATAFIRSFSDKASRDYFEKNAGQIIKMQERNIPVSTNFTIQNLAGGGTLSSVKSTIGNLLKGQLKAAGSDLGTVWNQAVNHPTFQRFMPQLQVQLFNDIEKSALRGGRSASEAADIAAKAVQNFYGATKTDVMARGQGVHDPLVQNFLGTFTFAPKFRESMINFWVNNVKSLKNPLALENRANVMFVAGATATYLAMDRINYALNGKHMSDNPPGTEDKLLIPTGNGDVVGVPFLSSIATIPRALYREGKLVAGGNIKGAVRDASQTYTSMLFKPFMDVVSNADYFGKKIYQDNATTQEKFTAQAKYLASQLLSHPYLKELTDPRNQNDPAIQRLSRAMELPFRFYTEASLATKYYFGARDKAVGGMSDQEQTAFNAIPKADTNDPNTRILKYQIYLTYPKVFEAKQKIELETAAKTGKAIDPLYLVDYSTAQKYMRYESLPEGSGDRKAMTQAYPELVNLFDMRGQYFDANPIPGTKASARPMPSPEVQAAMDSKNWTAPGVREYLDANTAYNNQQREKLGLPPLQGFAAYAKKPKKITIKKLSAKRIKISLPKQTKIATIKIAKLPTAKLGKSKKIAIKIKPIRITKLKGLTGGRAFA